MTHPTQSGTPADIDLTRRKALLSGAGTLGAAAAAAALGTGMAQAATSSTSPSHGTHHPHAGVQSMNTITTPDGTSIFYKDWGTGRPVVFSHGWPLNADAWDAQMLFLVQHGFRVIAHDRRGHGPLGAVSQT